MLVAAVPVAGTEPTSKVNHVSTKALGAFAQVHEVIVGAAAPIVKG